MRNGERYLLFLPRLFRDDFFTLLLVSCSYSGNSIGAKSGSTKGGNSFSSKLNSTIKAALARIERGGPDDYVFGKADGWRYKSIRTAFNNVVARAKLSDVMIHTLRHTFASRLVMAGVPLPTVQKLGGWKTLDMVMRYAHLSPSHMDEAIERIAENSTTLFTTPHNEAATADAVNI